MSKHENRIDWTLVENTRKFYLIALITAIFAILADLVVGWLLLSHYIEGYREFNEYDMTLIVIALASWIMPAVLFVLYAVCRKRINDTYTKEQIEEMELPTLKGSLLPAALILAAFLGLMAILGTVIVIGGKLASDDIGVNDVFEKDPNTWTDDDKEYVDNFFEWMGNQ